jgi:hypothetical protein
MAEASIKQISDFFKTGDPERDRLASFSAEWKALNEGEKQEIKEAVAEAIGL